MALKADVPICPAFRPTHVETKQAACRMPPADAWDVETPGKKLAPDRTRKSEYTKFILDGSFDMTDVNKGWADEFIKDNGLSPDILKADHKTGN